MKSKQREQLNDCSNLIKWKVWWSLAIIWIVFILQEYNWLINMRTPSEMLPKATIQQFHSGVACWLQKMSERQNQDIKRLVEYQEQMAILERRLHQQYFSMEHLWSDAISMKWTKFFSIFSFIFFPKLFPNSFQMISIVSFKMVEQVSSPEINWKCWPTD